MQKIKKTIARVLTIKHQKVNEAETKKVEAKKETKQVEKKSKEG